MRKIIHRISFIACLVFGLLTGRALGAQTAENCVPDTLMTISGSIPSIVELQPQSITSNDRNWVETRRYFGTGSSDYVSDIVYYNGLGLPEQSVSSAASGRGRSIVTPVTYDDCLRGDAREWLPFESSVSTGVFTSNATSASRYSSTYGAQESGHAFSENVFDSYSLNRKVSSRKPGIAHSTADRKSVTEYGISTSADQVKRIVYDPSTRSITVPTNPSPYVAGYQKTVTTDEDGRRSATFTDSEGKVILSRVYDKDASGEYVPYADTYTVYDGAGRPLWVISPEGSALVGPAALYTESGDVAAKWTTVYRYDGYGRLTGRRLPGCGWEEYIYDRGDRLVLERDSTLHAQNRWIYHVYDNLGREIERTVVSSTSSMESIQANYDTTPASNSYPYPSHAGSVGADYRKPYTSIGSFTLVKQLYQARYGNYKYRTGTSTTSTATFTVPSTLAFSAVTGVVSGESGNTNNLKVYEKVWMLDESVSSTSSNGYVERAFYYDGKGRLIQTVERNQAGGISRTSTRYDFRGLPLQISEQHSFSSSYKKASSQSRTVTYSYDNRGRVLTETVQVNSLPEAAVSYSYDGIGRLSEVTYGNGVSERRTYTVQGWLKEISALDSSRDALFRETMRYWDNPEIAGGSSHPLYSGMISGADSRNGSGTSSSGTLDYDYRYDYLWRLTEASLPGTDDWAEKGITYDRNGNLRSLTRHGGSGSILDALNLSYSGNRLAAVSHSGGTWSYGHDGSGRMTSDGRLGGIAVQYGETGLPRRTMGPPGSGITTTEYSYLADGTRLGVTQNIGTSSSTIYGYLSFGGVGMIQLGSNLSFESSVFDGGVIQSGGVRYFTRDHLGNTRVVTDGSGNVVERNDYYPFGERHSDSSMPTVNSNRWRFAGKEIQPLGGTGWLDFGARQYDSFLGRWTTVDPLAEKYPGISPYSYCAGNPINFVDPDGKFPGFLWDIANVVVDVKSLVSNIKDHNTGAAIADGVGLVVDAVAAVIPILPAGAGTALKAARSGEKVAETIKVTEKIEGSVSKTKGSVKGIIVAQENKIDRTLLNPPHKAGNAPTFKSDGTKVEIHHVGQNAEGPFVEMHWKDHRGAGNYSNNHPKANDSSKIDRAEFNKMKKTYWENEYR